VPSTPNDGRFVAFQALHEGRFRIWRMEPDGGAPRAVSRGQDDITPLVSPDGRWIYYAPVDGATIVRIPSDGGEVEPITTEPFNPRDISPDGRQLLVQSQADGTAHAVIDVETRSVIRRLSVAGLGRAKWGRRPDVVAYIDERDGVANVWEQPIDGGPPRQLTNFQSGRIFNLRYDPARTRLFLARGTRTGDVVLLRNFR
jgi:Tol biopolymer transport system component